MGGTASRVVCIGGICSRGVGQIPQSDTTGYGQRVGGSYPTGMHSCFTSGLS